MLFKTILEKEFLSQFLPANPPTKDRVAPYDRSLSIILLIVPKFSKTISEKLASETCPTNPPTIRIGLDLGIPPTALMLSILLKIILEKVPPSIHPANPPISKEALSKPTPLILPIFFKIILEKLPPLIYPANPPILS